MGAPLRLEARGSVSQVFLPLGHDLDLYTHHCVKVTRYGLRAMHVLHLCSCMSVWFTYVDLELHE